MKRLLSRPLLTFLLLIAAGAPISASSYVMVSDEALVDQAPVAAVVRIVSIDRAAGAGAQIVTEYVVDVEEALKGRPAGGTVRVRVPGGERGDGLGLKVYGAPAFRAGERALLFLAPERGGSYRLVHFFLGAFHAVDAGDRRVAVRSLAEATELRVNADGLEAVPKTRQPLRDFDAFARWVAARAAGEKRQADYLVDDAEGALGQAVDEFELFEDEDEGFNLRWFNFDTGGNIAWRAFATGQQGISGGGYSEFRLGLEAWTAEPQTPVDYRYAGTTTSEAGLSTDDGVNAVLFNDPQDLLDSFSCSSGGVLALGGPFYFTARTDWRGVPYHRIAEADIIINDGLSCFFARSSNATRAAQELFGHELGHTLGIGHACGDDTSPSCGNAGLSDALMRAFIHDDGRGARLAADDRNALRSLYDAGSAPTAPAAPTNLAATGVSTTEVQLTWTDRASSETGFRIEAKTLGGTYEEVGTVGPNATGAVVQELEPATGYSFRVRAFNAGGASAYSNEAVAATKAPISPCVPNAQILCLNGGRFRVQVAWQTATTAGPATVVPGASNDSGLFWFFGPDNWEMLIKVLNGCGANNRYWVFFAATTNVQYTVTVTDTQTGSVKAYFNPQGISGPAVTDTGAFATCP